MRNLTFYPKLALRNIRKNNKFYWPYLLSCVLSVMMFYIMFFIASNRGLLEMPGASVMPMFMGLGCVVIALFTAGLLFYSNNYLMKQRQKEIGLYNILGMDKNNLSYMLFFESLIIMVIALGGGIISGALFSRLVFLMLSKVVGYHVPFTLNFSFTSAFYTMFLYTIIFIAILIYNLIHLHVSKPIELLKGAMLERKNLKLK